MLPVQDAGEHAAECHSQAARYPDMEVGVVLPVSVLRHASLQAAGADDQAD